MITNPPEDFETANAAERFLKSQRPQNHQGLNPQNQEIEPKEDLAIQLQRGIYSSLTSDFAETIKTEREWADSLDLRKGERFQRFIMFQWDGVTRKNEKEDKDGKTQEELEPIYNVALILEGQAAKARKAKSEKGRNITPAHPDGLEIYMFDRNKKLLYLFTAYIDKEGNDWYGPSVGSVRFSDKSDSPETAAFGVERGVRSGKTDFAPEGTPLENLQIVNNILQNGKLDLASVGKYMQFYIQNLGAERISDLRLIGTSSPYMQSVLKLTLSTLSPFVEKTHRHSL